MSNRGEKVSKGYRLKPETHEKIKEIKKLLDADTDYVIYKACEYFHNKIKNIDKNKTYYGELK